MLKSALFWRITVCVFISILCIEAILLMFSWYFERERLVARLDNSANILVASLAPGDPVPQLQRYMANPQTKSDFQIQRILYKSANGTTSHRANSTIDYELDLSTIPAGYNAAYNTYVSKLPVTEVNGESGFLWIQVDATWLAKYMNSYVWRIMGMIMLISLFLTGACILFLNPLLIAPLRRLKLLLEYNVEEDFQKCSAEFRDINRSDELGAVFRSLFDLRQQVVASQEVLEHQANHDDLTGLANRRRMNQQLEDQVRNFTEHGKPVTLLILDLDHFKEVNDRWGHAAGDALLIKVATAMYDAVAENDLVARQGGDEFAIILSDQTERDGMVVASTIRSSVEDNLFVWDNETVNVTVSIGVAEISHDISSLEALLYSADTSCLEAKKLGKNQIVRHSNLVSESVHIEAIWIGRIKEALRLDQLTLFKHTIFHITNSSPGEHFEILVRMNNPDGGYYSPADFLPVAERNELMSEIDQWVISHALDWLNEVCIDQDKEFCMNVNISAKSLADDGFRKFLRETIEKNLSLTQFLCFEVTESAAMTNYTQTVALLGWLRSHGCRIALDDFGTGFSSLSQIRELPLDYIKIDGSFIQEIYQSELNQTVVKGVAEIAKVLRIKTVAEFVDNEAALKVLEDLNIDYAQGFLFSQPEELEPAQNSKTQKAA